MAMDLRFAPVSYLFRRLAMAILACLAITASPIAAQAAEENNRSQVATLTLATDGLSALDGALTWSETTLETMSDGAHDGAFDDSGDDMATSRFADAGIAGYTQSYRPSRAPIASYGPFHLISADTVEMIGTVDSRSPRQFAMLLAQHPGIRNLVMVDCPGSVDEAANHILARAVRRAGLSTHVPDGGSVRSGAVDLFLAGVSRSAARNAEFGVHSWRDEDGYEARDFAADDPVHAEYLQYYREMGLSDARAQQFYALTNSVDFDDVRTLRATDMAQLGLASVAG